MGFHSFAVYNCGMVERLERLHNTRLEDNRTASQIDRDRVMYSAAFRRLAHVTQVVGADQVNNFHNRLTHTLQVAQVARRSAEFLRRDLSLQEHICPDVCETAALAHDLGHPPFGHLAEKVLNKVAISAGLADGFEGNAQSFRIVTKLAAFDMTCEGLDLTRASLNAVLKYPWLFGRNEDYPKKWGAYDSETTEFEWARKLSPVGSQDRSIESQIMDWADDVSYSVHDVEDFFKAGLIPLDKLATSSSERDRFYDDVFSRGQKLSPEGLKDAFENMAAAWAGFTKYTGRYLQRQTLKSMASELIGSFVRSLKVKSEAGILSLDLDQIRRNEIHMLKELTRFYVFENSALKNMQEHQEAIVEGLFNIYLSAMDKNELKVFPTLTCERLEELAKVGDRQGSVRVIIDLLASMTELQITQTFHCLSATSFGSAFVHPLG
jgi:dGTPase